MQDPVGAGQPEQVAEDAAARWLALPNVVAVGGSWLAPAAEVERGEWDAITERARRAMQRLGGGDDTEGTR